MGIALINAKIEPVNLRKAILKEHSKAQTNRIVRWIGSNPERFDELIRLFLNDEYRVVQRAAWPLSYCAVNQPQLIRKHLGPLIRNLQKPKTGDAVKRNTLRLLQFLDPPKRLDGLLMNLCFGYVQDPGEKPAIKAFALTVLNNLSKRYPDIRREMETIITERWDTETPAFRARARKMLSKASR